MECSRKHNKKKCKFEENESNSSTDEIKYVSKVPIHLSENNLTGSKEEKRCNDTNDALELIIKNNKGKTFDGNGLKIESVGKSPILRIDKSKNKTHPSEANLKRLQSLNNFKKAHKAQKFLIQQALLNIDSNSNKKIIFDETENTNMKEPNHISTHSRKSLFEEEFQEDDFEPNFEIKEQFQGEKGQKVIYFIPL